MTRSFISGALAIAASAALAAQTPATRYNRTAEATIAGTIKALVSYPAADGGVGVHFDLKTPTGMVSVHVAPAAYLGQENAYFMADDAVEIIGARVSEEGRTTFWAKAIQKGSSVLVLRNADGTPKWTPTSDGTDGCGVNHPPLPRATEY
jgi:DsbC/DsbD-like thiol-disulfide interchange protein